RLRRTTRRLLQAGSCADTLGGKAGLLGNNGSALAAVKLQRVLHRDFLPQVCGQLIQQERVLLRARERDRPSRIQMLVAADDEAIREIAIELEPFGLQLAVDDRWILAWETGIELDLHVEIGMGLKQPAAHLRRAEPDVVGACMRPDDLRIPIVRKQS